MRLPEVPSDNKFRILIAEDDPSIAKLVSVHLKMAKFDVTVASDGSQAWRQFSQLNPHLLLTDINMPGLTGHELVEKVRGTSAIPILMMTAADTDEAQMQGFKVGADDYIAKPFNPKLLTARVIANLRRVYRYADTVAANAPTVDPSLPAGFVRCEACSYIGPVWKFETEDNAGAKVAMCPNCRNKNITFSVA